MFDFENTPITKDIELKAKWCCAQPGPDPWEPGPEGPAYTNDEMWDSDSVARLVLTDGREVICDDLFAMNMLFCGGSVSSIGWAQGNSTTKVSGFKLVNEDGTTSPISVSGEMVKSVELGRGYTGAQYQANDNWPISSGFTSSIFPNVTFFRGFAEGTNYIGSAFFQLPSTVKGAIINIPSTFSTSGNILTRLPYGTTQDQIAKVIFSSPNYPAATSSYNEFISAYNMACGSYPNQPVPPIPITGPYATQWKAAYPNRNPMGSACTGRNWVLTS